MEYQISDKAKKVTLGLSFIGLIMVVIGFFQQKDYIYAEYINEHSLSIKYNGDASDEMQENLKANMVSMLSEKGYTIDFHDAAHGHDQDHHAAEDASENHHEAHDHHGPTFLWEAHLAAANHDESAHDAHHENMSKSLVEMIESGEISFFDTHHRRFWSNLLVNGFFFFGIALGALFYLALHYATESGWGVVLLRLMEGIMSAMPVGIVVLLIVFIAGSLGMHHIYPWMDSDVVAHDDLIWGKVAYLNKPFFWIRIICYFGVFAYFMNWFRKTSRNQDSEDVEKATASHFLMYRRGALFLVFFAVFSSTMSWDIIMSIDTHWFSTLFGWYAFSGIWLSAMIMIMMVTLYLKHKGYLEFVNSSHIHDVGKWMFALSFLWSYLWFSQFMLIWYSNIPEEVIYFVTRIESYKFIFFAMFIVNFVLPMIFLMSADTKKSWPYLIFIGMVIFIGHWFDVFCMVMPGTLFEEWNFGLLEIGMFMTFLGTFVFLVLRALEKSSLVQNNHPFLEESKHHHG